MATVLLQINNLNFKAMKNRTAIRHGKNYHEQGIETITILLAVMTVAIIFYSIYSAF